MKKFYLAIVTWSLFMIIPTIILAEGLQNKIKYKYASLFFSSIALKSEDKILVNFTIDYDEGTSRNISVTEKGAMGEIVAEVCRKMAEIYTGIKSPSEKRSKMKILNMLGADGWEIVPHYWKDTTEGGLSHIEGYFLKKRITVERCQQGHEVRRQKAAAPYARRYSLSIHNPQF